jgi:hypothetical protein
MATERLLAGIVRGEPLLESLRTTQQASLELAGGSLHPLPEASLIGGVADVEVVVTLQPTPPTSAGSAHLV